MRGIASRSRIRRRGPTLSAWTWWSTFAGSAGVTRGPARVIHSLAEAGRLQRGDVLIAPATEPPWTPLFATATAVVTDHGGVLSHTAVVAREFRIPAVVGTGQATSTFSDGQLLEVDGDAGIVRVIVEG